jgi:hypothetical protein
MLATMPFRVTRQILHDNKTTIDNLTYQVSPRGQQIASLDNGDFKKKQKEMGLDSADEQRLV